MLKISPRNYNITYVENIPKELQHYICWKYPHGTTTLHMLQISPRNYNITYVENIPMELQHYICWIYLQGTTTLHMLKISPRNYNITYVENIPKELQHCICCKDIRFISQVSVAVPLRLQQLFFFQEKEHFLKFILPSLMLIKGV